MSDSLVLKMEPESEDEDKDSAQEPQFELLLMPEVKQESSEETNMVVPNPLTSLDETQDRVCNPEHCFKEGCLELKADKKQQLYKEFHSLSYDEQSSLLVGCISASEPKRRKKRNNDTTSRKSCTFSYNIGEKRVCQKTLLDTYSITQRRIQTLQSKIKDGIISPKDQRGRHKNRPHAIDDSVKQCVRDHISSFPKQPSHYSRRKSERDCLNPDLNLSKMYELFKQSHPTVPASRYLYKEIFRNDFNLRRSNTCRQFDRQTSSQHQ